MSDHKNTKPTVDDDTPIGTVKPRDGLIYFGRREPPLMFADFDESGVLKLFLVRSKWCVDEFDIDMDDFESYDCDGALEKASSCFKRALRDQSYDPGSRLESDGLLITEDLVGKVNPSDAIGSIPIGEGIAFLAGYWGHSDCPTICSHPVSNEISRLARTCGMGSNNRFLTVVGPKHHWTWLMKHFSGAADNFENCVYHCGRRPAAPAQQSTGCVIMLVQVVLWGILASKLVAVVF